MKILIILTFFIFAAANVYPQLENYDNIPIQQVKYYQDFLTFRADDGTSRLDVFVHVPYQEVQFVKTGQGFEAAYTVTVSVFNEDKKNLITEKIWNEKVVALAFNVTVSKENYNLSYRSFNLTPGKYFIKTSVLDKESRREYNSENMFTIRDIEHVPSMSDILFIAAVREEDTGRKIIPNISRNISTDTDGIPMFFEAYVDSAGEYTFDFIVSDNEKPEIYRMTHTRELSEGNNQLLYNLDSLAINLGTFLISVNMLDKDDNLLSTARKTFISRWKGIPATITDLDKAVDQMVYIASPDEMNKIKKSADNFEKTQNFVEFWKAKDPNPKDEYNPAFEEYYRRVTYSNENFTNYSLEGWRSDRGMVLITLGAPNNIDRYPFEYDSKPYEVWQYYDINRRFVFVDFTGFGDYRLTTPLYGDLFRYRY
jgi:GWxTD domain-containing protein